MSYNAATLARRLTGEKYTRHEGDDETSSLSSSSTSALQGRTSSLSNDECENIAKRIQDVANLPMECKDMKHRPIVATSGSNSLLYVPTWEFLDDYSGK
mmetsp:Transcript_121012/g.170244  ORF Transcript_121012/g.170244 Transcript_121012/m.170244 type:complete len:99 (+) Transcript_121012:30-326(+)